VSDWLFDSRTGCRFRRAGLWLIALSVIVVAAAHWWTPRGDGYLHAAHVLLRKLFLVPVVLAAIWFNLRGALLAAAGVTLLYAPHVMLQWSGVYAENMNQLSEIVTIWVTAGIAGILVTREKSALANEAKAYRGAIRALVAALDAREHDTEQHSERVCAYALRLADEMGVNGRQRRALALGALLHDVGKIGVPDRILLKPDRLTDDEWRQMREHPEVGKRILSTVPFLDEALEIVHAHHERYDGSGYPRGLAGSQIPLGARIFAVADVYDALTSNRPYRSAISPREARLEIERGAGGQFDPRVVRALRRIPTEDWCGTQRRT
jgi:putative nucleotidyltransferase with HDIG domain